MRDDVRHGSKNRSFLSTYPSVTPYLSTCLEDQGPLSISNLRGDLVLSASYRYVCVQYIMISLRRSRCYTQEASNPHSVCQ